MVGWTGRRRACIFEADVAGVSSVSFALVEVGDIDG
jgi:hypothetical protein